MNGEIMFHSEFKKGYWKGYFISISSERLEEEEEEEEQEMYVARQNNKCKYQKEIFADYDLNKWGVKKLCTV